MIHATKLPGVGLFGLSVAQCEGVGPVGRTYGTGPARAQAYHTSILIDGEDVPGRTVALGVSHTFQCGNVEGLVLHTASHTGPALAKEYVFSHDGVQIFEKCTSHNRFKTATNVYRMGFTASLTFQAGQPLHALRHSGAVLLVRAAVRLRV
jgi:hypothetical protein